MLENDIRDMPDLTFSMDADEEKLILYEREEVTDHELIPGGRNIRVTEENKHEYVDLVAEHRLTTAIRPQINAFLEGFNELIPKNLISIYMTRNLSFSLVVFQKLIWMTLEQAQSMLVTGQHLLLSNGFGRWYRVSVKKIGHAFYNL